MKDKKTLVIAGILLLLSFALVYFFLTRDSEDIPKDAEGYVYETVEIGEQIWFAENLKTPTHEVGESWCYDDNEENCEVYGRLYDWDAAVVACPRGWALPTDEDWQELEEYLGVGDQLAAKLKSSNYWKVDEDKQEDYRGLDEYGLGFLPGGHYVEGYFYDIEIGGFWWTSSRQDSGPVWSRTLLSESNDVIRSIFGPEHAFSVRCIRKAEAEIVQEETVEVETIQEQVTQQEQTPEPEPEQQDESEEVFEIEMQTLPQEDMPESND